MTERTVSGVGNWEQKKAALVEKVLDVYKKHKAGEHDEEYWAALGGFWTTCPDDPVVFFEQSDERGRRTKSFKRLDPAHIVINDVSFGGKGGTFNVYRVRAIADIEQEFSEEIERLERMKAALDEEIAELRRMPDRIRWQDI